MDVTTIRYVGTAMVTARKKTGCTETEAVEMARMNSAPELV